MDFLAENTVLEWVVEEESRTYKERILYVEPVAGDIVVIELREGALPAWKRLDEVAEAVAAGQAVRGVDPYSWCANPDPSFLSKHVERRDRAWRVIEGIAVQEPEVYLEDRRGRLIRNAEDVLKVDRTEIYRLLRRYWLGGKIKNALLPLYDRCGGLGRNRELQEGNTAPKRGRPPNSSRYNPEHIGVNVDQGMAVIFDIAVKLYYHKDEGNSLKDAYDEMVEKYFSCGIERKYGIESPILLPSWEVPTYRQFCYWYRKKVDLKTEIIKRQGRKTYELTSRPILGNSSQSIRGPGSVYQIDATIADIYLVSRLNRTWIIGRPVVYFVIDVFSRMCAGLYVGLEGPSWTGAGMAIANATMDKVEYCAEYGIEITSADWPTAYLPQKILGDRGELIGEQADSLAASLNITPENCPPYRADLKGIVEQRFKRAKERTVKWTPGYVQKVKERGTKDYRLDATLDLHQFTKLMIIDVLEYNQFHVLQDYLKEADLIRDSVPPIPIHLWNWGIKHRSGLLQYREPDVIKIALMTHDKATVTERGIEFDGAFYDMETANAEHWYVKARTHQRWDIDICYDPRCISTIYWLCGGSKIERCTMVERDGRFVGMTYEEVGQYLYIEGHQQAEHENNQRQSRANLRAATKAIVEQAREQTMAAHPENLSKSARVKDIKKKRQEEKEMNRREESFTLNCDSSEKSVVTSSKTADSNVDDSYVMTDQEQSLMLIDLLDED